MRCLELLIWTSCVSVHIYLCPSVASKELYLCPHGWNTSYSDRTCIQQNMNILPWVKARQTCKKQGGDLLSSYSKERERAIYGDAFRGEVFYIALNARRRKGVHRWPDGSRKITPAVWGHGEPKFHEDCVFLYLESRESTLASVDCSLGNYFLCEKRSACTNNTFGANCSYPCNPNCGGPSNACDNFDGYCKNGCDDGFHGHRCDVPCRRNTFGPRCSKTCNPKCGGPSNACDIITGFCKDGCDDGYQGNKCDVRISLCPFKWLTINSARLCLLRPRLKKPWDEAREMCRGKGGDLLSSYNQEMQRAILGARSVYWIGLNDREKEGVFRWPDGKTTVTNAEWAINEPNDDGNEDCVAISLKNRKTVLNDLSCSSTNNFICEKRSACTNNTFGEDCEFTCNLNCGGQSNACDNFNGFCKNGCDDGYLGDRCNVPCPYNTFGPKCSQTCNPNCGGPKNACDSITGFCKDGCDNGYLGNRCDVQISMCPHGWNTSYSDRTCIQQNMNLLPWVKARQTCKKQGGDLLSSYSKERERAIYGDAYRGEIFYIGLNDRRREGVFRWQDRNKSITPAVWGYREPTKNEYCAIVYLDLGESTLASLNCSVGSFFLCEKHSACTNNTFGAKCSFTCNPNCGGPSNACDSFDGFCKDGCDDGYLGDRCEIPCSRNHFGHKCYYTCNSKCGGPSNACNISTGFCKDGCDNGYRGNRCDLPCTANTFGPNCLKMCNPKCGGPKNACDRFTGLCSDGCDAGFRGDRCEVPCPQNTFGVNCSETCSQNCGGSNNACDNVNGFCTFGCDDGYQGKRCQTLCAAHNFGQNCMEMCNPKCGGPKNACDLVSRICIDGCDDGFRGERCDSPCPQSTFGLNCSKNCSENCGGPNNTCDNVNGFCTFGCDSGYQGKRCQTYNTIRLGPMEICNPKCGGPKNACDRFTGLCSDGCDAGFRGDRCEAPCAQNTFGVNCSETCSQNCGGPNNTCDNVNGFCTFGCDSGYQGKRCQTSCPQNTFGLNCSKNCSENCGGPNNTCDNVNGFCTFGCDFGYQGKRCQAFMESNMNPATILAKVMAALILLLLLFLVVMSLPIRSLPEANANEAEEKISTSCFMEDSTTVVGPSRSISGGTRYNFPANQVSAVLADGVSTSTLSYGYDYSV
ncbi:hypothetical protein RRG08_047459 [Elysia crispata]|uniref:C-type lectin domain-containing protein n=1 Tax=Elysia crispata TaxID=231223 RepID=A0AAE0YU36_9GAST|nr:hypothetical protein RRG08_047459 [Elysia crispata]